MGLLMYRLDALGAWVRAQVWRLLWGARLGRRVKVHAGARLRGPRGCAVLGEGAELYRDVQVLCTAGGRFSLGAGSHIAPGGYLLVAGQALQIGESVAIGPQVAVFCSANGSAAGAPFVHQRVEAPVHIGRNVFIGARVTLLPGAVVDDDVVVAAHAVVRGHLASGWVYGGVPARPLHRLKAPPDAALDARADARPDAPSDAPGPTE